MRSSARSKIVETASQLHSVNFRSSHQLVSKMKSGTTRGASIQTALRSDKAAQYQLQKLLEERLVQMKTG